LEYERVLRRVADGAAFSLGQDLALALDPSSDFHEVVSRQRLTAEAVLLYQMGIDIPFASARDIRPAVTAAQKEQVLGPPDLTEVANCLRTAVRARRTLERIHDRVPGLMNVASVISEFHNFAEAVDEAIDDRGEVTDQASDTLATVRRQLRVASQRLEQRAQAALADAIRRGVAQEGLLTERNGRKVVPVKADYRGQLAGIVHDVSSSGATVFIEPMAVVDAGNEVRELELAEEREVRRILRHLTELLAAQAFEAEAAIDALGHLDLYCALARYGRSVKAQLPPAGDGDSWLRGGGRTTLVRARHPLLAGDVVPIDLSIGDETLAVLVTGPNTGGKTVALKTLGLLTLMAQSGIPVPCDEGSVFAVAEDVLADIGDEQSIEQSLSTFSAHMRNIIAILERAGPNTLVLLDELGAGTDPTEGASLAWAILETLVERGARVVATTHHGELKALAHQHPAIQNASVEFDLETLSPTYHLTVGLPGQSNALAIARRLGLGADIVERAQRQLGAEHFEMETLLDEIRRERAAAADARRADEQALAESEDIRVGLARRRDTIEDERVAIMDTAAHAAETELAQLRRDLDRIRRDAMRGGTARDAETTLAALDERAGRLRRESTRRRAAQPPMAAASAIEQGSRIHVRDIPQAGEALGPVGDDGKVDAQFGGLRMKVSIERIDRVETGTGRPVASLTNTAPGPAVSAELDIRGRRADEALELCEHYLDDAFRAGLPFVRIIHGKGTGALRAAIREALADNPLVRRYESGAANSGGDGVTVATLAVS
jgi:DNA mismatch repair protein MutS2